MPAPKSPWLLAALALFLLPAHAQDPGNVIHLPRQLDFPCWVCLAMDSQGGGRFGATAAVMDLHVTGSRDDVSFPRALVARVESWCTSCQATALQAQTRGYNIDGEIFAANFEAYGPGRGTVAEFNIGLGRGGYVLNVVPVKMPDGSPSIVDAVMNVEGFGYDPGVARIGAIVDIKINPTRGVIIIPSDQGPVTVMATSDGRMREVWEKDWAGRWARHLYIDDVAQP